VCRGHAGVPRPHPVVDIPAVNADRPGRCVDQAHVTDLELLDQAVAQAAVEALHATTMPFVFFTGADEFFPARFDGVEALGSAE
jgi:hypothetical protein